LATPNDHETGCGGEACLPSALSLDHGKAVCVAGINAPPADCSSRFALHVSAAGATVPPVAPADLAFEIESPGGTLLDSPFQLTVLTPQGCGTATYDSPSNSWTAASIGPGCPQSVSATTPLASGESFDLTALPGGGIAFSQPGAQLVAVGVGAFSGTVATPVA
ncbi:MAG TPA: hypothetical protein VGP88_00780, partial [Thermoplasmata archaeon]|nr:hypothetical protein [Thermoplasmata archaeon]